MKKQMAIALAAGLLTISVSAVSAMGISHGSASMQTLGTKPVQNINGHKIPGAPNGMIAGMLEGHHLGTKHA